MVEVVTLYNLAQGAVLELFQVELQRALDDIADVNRKAEDPREVQFKVRLTPDGERESCLVAITARTKLGTLRTVNTQLFLGRQGGQNVAVEHNPKQSSLFEETVPAPPNAPLEQKVTAAVDAAVSAARKR